MESEMLQSPLLGLGEEDEADLTDWNLPLAFMKKRHCEKIEGSKSLAQSWRMKDRMKTVSVALVLCLNVGVDPPDVVKTTPCARLECWIDPLSMGPQKALETIGANLQKQYENWQPRPLNPTEDSLQVFTARGLMTRHFCRMPARHLLVHGLAGVCSDSTCVI
ncbi:PREDICTED: regulatory-associated protein of mTOR-like, partial [Galeopterus variegatus]|uniref:Regulatory-associated protein of mTOR-like n=1 Tax=Galeopterus variegatus TaxID=482537 RepID=A0ABM0R8S1_GALVR